MLTLVLLTLFSLRQIYWTFKQFQRKQIPEKSKSHFLFIDKLKKNKKLLSLLAICFICFLIALFNVYNQYYFRGLSGAETHQFFASTLDTAIIEVSYKQQQPPLDYYFSSFSNELWGMSKFSVRFHAMLFYLILSSILPLMLWCLCPSFLTVIPGSFLFVINHAVKFHSVNGRPLSLTLLTGFLFLFFYICYCKNRQYKKQSLFFPILASQYLFIISIGFQPVVFVLSLFLSSFYLLLKNEKKIFKKLFLSHILTALLVFPIYINMYSFGRDAHKFKDFSLKKIIHYMENYNSLNLFEKYFYPFYEQLSFSFLLLVIGLIIVVSTRKKLSNSTVQIGCALIFFPLLFDFLFEIIINWGVSNWYFIVYSLFFIIFCVLTLNEILLYLKKHQLKPFILIPMILIFLFNCYSQIKATNKKSHNWRNEFLADNSIEQVYNYLKEKGNSSDIAVEISLTVIPLFRSTGIKMLIPFLHEFDHHPVIFSYFLKTTDIPPFFYEKPGDEIPYINWKNVIKKKHQKIFFIAINDRNDEDIAHSVLSNFMEEKKIGNLSIFEWILKTENRENEYKEFLVRLLEKTPKKYQAALYETLLYYACKNKKKGQFIYLLKKYRELESFLNEFIGDTKLPSRFTLKRRAKFFENMSYCNKEN